MRGKSSTTPPASSQFLLNGRVRNPTRRPINTKILARPRRSAMTAERIATSLGGHRAGEGWLARCPAHDDRRPSLSIAESTDGRVPVCCQAGCEQRRVIDSLRALGLWSGGDKARRDFSTDKPRLMDTTRNQQFDADRTERALRIWRSSGEARGTLVERRMRIGKTSCVFRTADTRHSDN
jgi:hypothetical protein